MACTVRSHYHPYVPSYKELVLAAPAAPVPTILLAAARVILSKQKPYHVLSPLESRPTLSK